MALSNSSFSGKYLSPQFPTFLCDTTRLNRDYLGWVMKRPSFWNDLGSRASGMGDRRRTLNPEALLSCQILLPPLDEQSPIVSRLKELSNKIEEVTKLRDYSASVTEALTHAINAALLTPLPHWIKKTVADVISSIDAGWSPQCEKFPASDNEWGVLKTTAVQWCEFHPEEKKALPKSLQPAPELAIQDGDVLVTRAGPLKRVGVIAAVPKSFPKLMISDKLMRLRVDRATIEPRFLELALSSPASQEHFFHRKTGLADAQVNISQAILMATPISFPELAEQRKVVAEVDGLHAKLRDSKALQSQAAVEMQALLPAILNKALGGDL